MNNIIFSSMVNDLKNATKTNRHPFRYFTLATSDYNGIPRMRTVVLREANDELQFTIYTDKRSKKITHIQDNNNVSLLFMDTERLLQISIQAKASIITDDFTLRNIWKNIPQKSRKDYTSRLAPGEQIKNPNEIDFLESKHFFSAIQLEPNRIEYLRLKRPNHIRLLFNKENRSWKHTFLVP